MYKIKTFTGEQVTIRNALDAAKWSQDWTPTGMPIPTQAQPGSSEKLMILSRRLERGEELWHPHDYQCVSWACALLAKRIHEELFCKE